MLFNPRVGLWAGLITASSIIFTVSARAATVDSALVFVTTLAVFCFVIALKGQGRGRQTEIVPTEFSCDRAPTGTMRSMVGWSVSVQTHPQFELCNFQNSICTKTLFQYGLIVLLYVCLGMAILAKGPVGFLLPMASMGLCLMIVNSRRETGDAINAIFDRWLEIKMSFGARRISPHELSEKPVATPADNRHCRVAGRGSAVVYFGRSANRWSMAGTILRQI